MEATRPFVSTRQRKDLRLPNHFPILPPPGFSSSLSLTTIFCLLFPSLFCLLPRGGAAVKNTMEIAKTAAPDHEMHQELAQHQSIWMVKCEFMMRKQEEQPDILSS